MIGCLNRPRYGVSIFHASAEVLRIAILLDRAEYAVRLGRPPREYYIGSLHDGVHGRLQILQTGGD